MFYQAQFFLTGYLLLDLYLNEWEQLPKKEGLWDIISIVSWITVVIILFMPATAEIFIVIPMFIAYCAAFKGPQSNRFFTQPLVYTIGGMCYTIYLYHYPIISAFGRVILKSGMTNYIPIWLGLLISCMILAPIVLFFCTLLFVLIEKPCMKRDWYRNVFSWGRLKAGITTND